MKQVIGFIKNWALIIALLIGFLGHSFFIRYADKNIYIIFVMLFFTFCRLDPSQLRVRKVHLLFVFLQVAGAIAFYYLLQAFGWTDMAQTVMLCVLCPTAAASAVVTMKLGGDMASNTTYVLLSSLVTAVLVPLWFPLINPAMQDIAFLTAFWRIFRKVLPILAGPFLLAMLLKWVWPKAHDWVAERHEVSFYVWCVCLVFASAQMVNSILMSGAGAALVAGLAAVSAVFCVLHFFIGKRLGARYGGDSISGGQSLGQKNIVLGIWIAATFLSPDGGGSLPIAVAGLGTYIIWQNIVNSRQLYLKQHGRFGKTKI